MLGHGQLAHWSDVLENFVFRENDGFVRAI